LIVGTSTPEVATPAKTKQPKAKNESSERIGRAAVAAARALVDGGYSALYDDVRHLVLWGFAMAFARAYGMRATDVDARLLGVDDKTRRAFVDAVQSLDYAALTPEHFGHVHEHLSAWRIVDGGLQFRGTHSTVHFTPRSLTEPTVQKTLAPLLRIVPPERTLELRICDPSVGAGAFLLELVRQLGQRLIDGRIERDILIAKRLVAVHCAYGVDICRWAVASAKIALWLECHAENMPAGWLDDNIKVGDGLVGLVEKQMVRFHWSPDGKTKNGAELPEIPELRAVYDRALSLGVQRRQERIASLATAARGAP
jgi:hypothetical protein